MHEFTLSPTLPFLCSPPSLRSGRCSCGSVQTACTHPPPTWQVKCRQCKAPGLTCKACCSHRMWPSSLCVLLPSFHPPQFKLPSQLHEGHLHLAPLLPLQLYKLCEEFAVSLTVSVPYAIAVFYIVKLQVRLHCWPEWPAAAHTQCSACSWPSYHVMPVLH